MMAKRSTVATVGKKRLLSTSYRSPPPMPSNSSPSVRRLLAVGLFLSFPAIAEAHVGVGSTGGFLHGVTHPITGLDHLCAMIAVGAWAAQRGGRAIWLVPLAFLTVMSAGALLGMAAVAIPFVEPAIIASVLVLGVFIAAAVRLPLIAS